MIIYLIIGLIVFIALTLLNNEFKKYVIEKPFMWFGWFVSIWPLFLFAVVYDEFKITKSQIKDNKK